MSVSRTFTRAMVVVLPVLALTASSAFAQDVDAMAKWTALTVVHYKVVGEFSGQAPLVSAKVNYGVSVSAAVTDRVEIDFDWNQEEMKLVGKPVIKNFPSKAGAITPREGCPGTKVEGGFEFATVVALKDVPPGIPGGVPGGVLLEVRRDHPGGAVPRPGSESGTALCGHAWDTIAPASNTSTDTEFGVPLAMALAVPGIYPITPDGKSLILKANGWTWTFTPTPGK